MKLQQWTGVVLLAVAGELAIAVSMNAQTGTAAQLKTSTPMPQSDAPKAVAHTVDEGQRVFEQNCSRCHTAPDGFSQRISGAVVHHMRVRASLSEHDEQVLLRFFSAN